MPIANILSGELQNAMYRDYTAARDSTGMNQVRNQEPGSENQLTANASDNGDETSVSQVDQQESAVSRFQPEDDNRAVIRQVPMNQYDPEVGNQIDIFA